MIQQEDIRIFLQDYPHVNLLLEKEEFSAEQVNHAIFFTVARYNEMPPFTTHTPDNFPFVHLLLIGTVAYLLKGKALEYHRNRLTYQTGEVSVDDKSMANPYSEWAQVLDREYKQEAKDHKIATNLKSGWGDIFSEYSNIYRGRGYR